jgi:hypothetical protein
MNKQTENPRGIKLLYSISNFLFGLSILLSAILISVLIWGTFGNDIGARVDVSSGELFINHSIDVDSDNVSEESKRILENDQSGFSLSLGTEPVDLNNERKYLAFHTLSISARLAILFFTFTLLLLTVSSVYYFRRFMKSINRGDYFVLNTMKSLKFISYNLLAIWIVGVLQSVLLSSTLTANEEGCQIGGFSFSIVIDGSSFSLLFLGLAFWVLSQIFLQGVRINDENKLTI